VKKVFYFDSPREKYHWDAAIIWCFDNRFELGFRKFLKRIGVINSDPIKIAGGAKCLASPEHETDREFVLEQIRKSMRLHGTGRVILMLHSDCGAYGGLAGGFHGDARAEAEHHHAELRRAAANLTKSHTGNPGGRLLRRLRRRVAGGTGGCLVRNSALGKEMGGGAQAARFVATHPSEENRAKTRNATTAQNAHPTTERSSAG
jgi:hypothetical protein